MEGSEPARLPIRSPEALGEAIARRRIEVDLTQDELAEAIGVSRRYVYNIESGEPNLYARRLFDSLRELGLRIELVPDAAGRRHQARARRSQIAARGESDGP
ncbi:hypothetical protein Lsed01_00996 [Demequina sediminis]|jgi:transcriptional regulator with XRE-family HTH domain|uniref:HTH cro/C1-type domain-containing protein n=1 Tax=Demequina sediminis TaxID=1930058 RepID=A0ABP9WIW0_9MICO|nr:helix-turn-helix domain-containing protein [Demequina sediminis]BDZ62341.1 hypothetical protein GCM10025873_21320 [Demequina sediminis]